MNLVNHPWNIVFLVGFVVYMAIRHVYMARTKNTEKSVSRIDGIEKILLVVVFAGSLLVPVLYLLTPLFGFADYAQPAYMPWCGAAVMAPALWLFWRSHADLGLNWSMSLEMRREHELVRTGVYRRMRHPMYAAIFLFGVAQALLLPNWVAGLAALVSFAPMYIVRTPREERLMVEAFGEEYEAYMQETWRVFPKIG